jgi:hypothetical protein
MNKWSVAEGEDRATTMRYLRKQCRETPISDAVLSAFVDNAQPMIDYMDKIFYKTSKKLLASTGGALGFGDYNAEWVGGRADAFRSIKWAVEGDRAKGSSVTIWREAYIEAVEMLGGQIMLQTKAVKFVYRLNDAGVPEVLGVIAVQNGKEIALKANLGVLMGAGGFEWNDELRNSFLAGETPYACSLATNDGTAFKMTLALGPQLTNMSECYGQLAFKEKAVEQKRQGLPVNIIFERYFPHQIIVNKKGKRFMNESSGYDTVWLSMVAPYDTYGQNERSNLPAYQIFSQDFIDNNGPNAFKCDFFVGNLDNRGVPEFFKRYNTIEELADGMGINKANLVAEVAKYNGFCGNGVDEDFHRGEDYMDRQFNRMRDLTLGFESTLGAIEHGPFYAAEVAPNTLGTCGGPVINEHAQIMHVTGAPIGRLYGAGNFTGFGGPGRGYGGGGGTIGPGLVFAHLAGLHAANNLTPWRS